MGSDTIIYMNPTSPLVNEMDAGQAILDATSTPSFGCRVCGRYSRVPTGC